MDYCLPDAGILPDIVMEEMTDPSPSNPEGFKGIAEGGVMPPMAAILSALEDAVRPVARIRLGELPVTPDDLYRAVQAAVAGPGGAP